MTIVQLLLGLLPPSRLKNRLLGLTARKWSIAPSARIHPVLLWRVGTLRVGENAYVGAGNAFREMLVVDLGERADIGQLNWLSGQSQYVPLADENLAASLVLRPHAAMTSRHYVDCSGGVLLAGTTVPANSMVAAGAVTAKPLEEPGKTYGGVPARVVADLADASDFHGRTEMRLYAREDAQELIKAARRRHAEA